MSGRVGQMIARSPADREVRCSKPTMEREFLRAQEMNLPGSTRSRCDLVP